jgi:hypothetical protein
VVLVVLELTPLIRVLPEVLVVVRELTLLAPMLLLLLELQTKALLEERQDHSLRLQNDGALVVVVPARSD